MIFSMEPVNVLLGIGNDSHGDDSVGPYVAKHLQDENWIGINCGIVPENYVGITLRHAPEHIVIVDAADMEIERGGIRIIPPDSIGRAGFSTHSLSLSLLLSHLTASTDAIVTIIGIQPGRMQGVLTSEVKKAAHYIISLVKENRMNEIDFLRE